MTRSRTGNQARALVWFLCALQIVWPLNAMTVYAQTEPEETTNPAVVAEPLPTPRQEEIESREIPEIARDELAQTEEHTFMRLDGTLDDPANLDSFLRIYPFPSIDYTPSEEELDAYYNQVRESDEEPEPFSTAGHWINDGFYQAAGSHDGIVYWMEPSDYYVPPEVDADVADEGEVSLASIGVETPAPTTPAAPSSDQEVAETAPLSCAPNADGQPVSTLCARFQTEVEAIREDIESIGAFERRLLVSSGSGKAVLLGETCDPSQPMRPAQDVLVNGKCDRTPRVDARIILLLDYLLKPRSQGGGGREFLEISVAQFGDKPRPEGAETTDGVAPKCVVDTRSDVTDPRGISTCLQIKAVDKIRITTQIKKYGIFGTKTTYRYKQPIPIKVAWQSEEGQASNPLPSISTQELVGNLGMESLLQLLEEEDFLADPDFRGRPLQSVGIGDLARFVGGRLLKQLMDGQNISRFSFNDTIEDFGILALSGALNISPEVLRGATSLEDIEVAQGRSWVGQQIGLDKPVQGDNPRDLFADVGRQQLAKLLDIKPYVFENYQAGEVQQQLGQGLIETRLPVPERSFTSNDYDEVRRAVGAGRFGIIFPGGNQSAAQAQMAEIDERLGVPVGTTQNFVSSRDVAAYKRIVGQAVWDSYLGRYSDTAPGTYTPEHPVNFLRRLVTDGSAQPVGDLTNILNLSNPTDSRAVLSHPVRPSGADADMVALFDPNNADSPLRTLHNRIAALHNTVAGVLDDVEPSCFVRTGTGSTSCLAGADTSAADLISARQSVLSRLPKAQLEDELSAITQEIGQIMVRNSLQGNSAMVPSAQSEYRRSAAAYLLSLQEGADKVRDLADTFRRYGSNADGSSQRIDQMMNLPPGTVYRMMAGGDVSQQAFAEAGIHTAAQYLPTTSDRSRFIMVGTNAIAGTSAPFVATDSQKQFLGDVFLGQAPKGELRRIGRRVLMQNLSQSAQAESLQQTELFGDIQFYISRYEVITSALHTMRSEAERLQSMAGSLPDRFQGRAEELRNESSSLYTLFSGISPSSLSLSGARNLVNEKKDQINRLRDRSNEFMTSLEEETNSFTGQIQSAINNMLGASRAIEQAVMDVLEGRPSTFNSSIPGNLSIPEIDLGNFQSNQNNGPQVRNCNYRGRMMSVLTVLYGDIRTGADITNPGDWVSQERLKTIFITLGSLKLSELLGLPMESLLYFSQAEDKTPDSFFVSVGRGILLSQCQDPSSKTDDELKESGQSYVINHVLRTLSDNLGIDLPDWVNEQTIAGMMNGRVDEILLAVGSNQIETLLELPSGFVSRMVKPEGVTEAARQASRETAIIETVLSRLNIELDLPAGFTLTGDIQVGMGLARIENLFGFKRGQLDENQETAKEALDRAIEIGITEAKRGSRLSSDDEIILEADTEIAIRRQFMAGLGLPAPLGLNERYQALQAVKNRYQQLNNGNSNLTEDRLVARAQVTFKQGAILEILRTDNEAIFTSDHVFTGLEQDPNTSLDAKARWEDGHNRQEAFLRRLQYVDARMGVPDKNQDPDGIGTTRKWLIGQLTTEDFARTAGGGAAEQLGANAFIAFLNRIGVEGAWVDAIKDRRVDQRTGKDNLTLLKDVVLGRNNLGDNAVLAQLYEMMSKSMSFNLDEEAGFEAGTVANIIARPGQADRILFDQGVRIFAREVLHFDIGQAQDEGKTLKRLAAAMLYGAAYNPATGRFEGVDVNGNLSISLNGGRSVLYGLAEFTRISESWLRDQINRLGAAEARFFQAPISTLFAALYQNFEDLGVEMNYIQMAQSQHELRQRVNAGISDPTLRNAEHDRVNVMGNHAAGTMGARTPDLPAATALPTNDRIFDVGALDGFITQSRPLGTVDQVIGEDERASLDVEAAGPPNVATAPTDSGVQYSIPSTVPRPEPPSEAQRQTSAAAVAASGQRASQARNSQAFWQETLRSVGKSVAYAAADYGLDKLLNLAPGVIRPGLAQTLFEGTTSQKISAILDIGINYLLKNVSIPQELQFLVNYDNIRQITAFFLNVDNRGQLLAQAFSEGGIFSDIQNRVFPHGVFGEIALPRGTFAAMVGFAFNGNARDFQVNGVNVKGLGNLFNTRWAMEVGAGYIGKLLGVEKQVLVDAFKLTYDFYKAFTAWNSAASNPQAFFAAGTDGAKQVAKLVEGGMTTQEAQAAVTKQLNGQMYAAAIALGIFALNLLIGKQLAKFETAIGLPPGTILQALSLVLTAILVGTGPMFFVGLGIFVLTTLLGFGFVKTTIRATADGYYPLRGKLGDETRPGYLGIQYNQFPSSDIVDENGAVLPHRALGEFDPTKEAQKKEGFTKAARAKVKGLITDILSMEKYARAARLVSDADTEQNQKDLELIRELKPRQIMFINTQDDDGKKLYSDDRDIIRLNRRYYNETGRDDPSGYCNTTYPAGICAGHSGMFVDYLEVSY